MCYGPYFLEVSNIFVRYKSRALGAVKFAYVHLAVGLATTDLSLLLLAVTNISVVKFRMI